MRAFVTACVLLVVLLSHFTADSNERPNSSAKTCRVRITLIDAVTREPVAGLIQVRDAQDELLALPELLGRGRGLEKQSGIREWSVMTSAATIELPRAMVSIAAFSGLETERAKLSVDLTGKDTAEVNIPLHRFYDAERNGYWSANTHVHLRKLSRGEADTYLTDVGRADDLDVVFVSYLERHTDDATYTTNTYSPDELHRLSTQHVHFGHGEEHRHNFAGFGQGYGHVMLLEIPQLIQPVSIGPGISKTGTDGIPLRRGIDEARRTGGTVIWCHNAWGLEDVPSWLGGRLHANNIFDGGTHGSYRHSFYRYLNAGIKVPFSTGTDWFIYDFSRVYVPLGKERSLQAWLDELAAGHSYITNGPLLDFTVAGQGIGRDVQLVEPGRIEIRGSAVGRTNFGRLELIRNGEVIRTVEAQPDAEHFAARMELELDVAEPCWLALRTPPPSVPDDPDFQQATRLNEYGRETFSHTSATFVDVAGQRVFDRSTAEELLTDMREARQTVTEQGLFADAAERHEVLSVYEAGIVEMERRLKTSQTR